MQHWPYTLCWDRSFVAWGFVAKLVLHFGSWYYILVEYALLKCALAARNCCVFSREHLPVAVMAAADTKAAPAALVMPHTTQALPVALSSTFKPAWF